jgi:hypothetical protein
MAKYDKPDNEPDHIPTAAADDPDKNDVPDTNEERIKLAYDKLKGSKGAKIVRDSAILAVFGAVAFVAGVEVLHNVFTVPEHTIQFDDAMLVTIPTAIFAVVARDVLGKNENHFHDDDD